MNPCWDDDFREYFLLEEGAFGGFFDMPDHFTVGDDGEADDQWLDPEGAGEGGRAAHQPLGAPEQDQGPDQELCDRERRGQAHAASVRAGVRSINPARPRS